MKTKKSFRLFKRADDGSELPPTAAGYKERHYYFRFTYRGKAYPRCLETNDATEAQRRAKAKFAEITSAVQSGEFKRLHATKLRSEQTATIADLIAAYTTGPAEAGADTRKVNINAFRALIGDSRSVRELTPALVRRWFESVTAAILAEPDQERAASLKRSANSRWAQARSLFTDRALAHYQDLELIKTPDDLAAFVRAGDAARFTRIPKKDYNPPSEKIITATLAAWEALTDRDIFLAIGHELSFGLRLGEMAQARWSWHTTRNDYPVLDARRATVKNGSGLIQVRALDPYFSTMKRIATERGWWPAPETDADIIGGTMTYRTDGLFRGISEWMRQLGWETTKTNHALRAYAGSQVAMKYGIYEAQMFLRHSTVKVTEQNYSHFVSKFKPADLNTIPVKWATNASASPVEPVKVTSAPKDDTLDATRDFRKTLLNSSTVLEWSAETRN